MPSHISSIGFQFESKNTHEALTQLAYSKHAKTIESAQGTYRVVASACGAELWFQVSKQNELIGLQPHYRGTSRVKVGLTERIVRQEEGELDGAFHGWVDPATEDVESGFYPFVFDCPDADCKANMKIPQIVEVQIAAFAHDLNIYNSVEAFNQSPDNMGLHSESFIPSGLFSPEDAAPRSPEARAIFTGTVLESKIQSNSFTGHTFFWAKVSTFGGIFEVVADPEHIKKPAQPGNILSGSFWLSGRILACQKEQTSGFLSRIF